jgi:hypothetical protein
MVIGETIDLLQSELERKSMTLIQEIAPQLPPIEADQNGSGKY